MLDKSQDAEGEGHRAQGLQRHPQGPATCISGGGVVDRLLKAYKEGHRADGLQGHPQGPATWVMGERVNTQPLEMGGGRGFDGESTYRAQQLRHG